jgi:hypothetical protein
MAPGKQDGRTRRQGRAGRGQGGVEPVGRAVEEGATPGPSVIMIDVDPWGAFLGKFWEQQAEGEDTDRHDSGREPTERARTTASKPGRRGRSPRMSRE